MIHVFFVSAVTFFHMNFQSFMIPALLTTNLTLIPRGQVMYTFHVLSHQVHVSTLLATYGAAESILIGNLHHILLDMTVGI